MVMYHLFKRDQFWVVEGKMVILTLVMDTMATYQRVFNIALLPFYHYPAVIADTANKLKILQLPRFFCRCLCY